MNCWQVNDAMRELVCDSRRLLCYCRGGMLVLRLLRQTDLEQVLAYIERNHMETTFLNANVVGFGLENDGKTRRCGDYYGYFVGKELKGILPFFNLGSCLPHFETDAAIPDFVEVMKDKQFDSLLGMRNCIYPLYKNLESSKETLNYSESSYFINHMLTPVITTEGSFCDAEAKDEEAVIYIANAYSQGFNHQHSLDEVRTILKQKLQDEDFILLKVNGKIVAQANVQTQTSKINQIGSVYTSDTYRGMGYCKAIVSELCRRIIGRGKTPTLMVKKQNTPAVRAYQALGFEPYQDYLIIRYRV